MLEKLFGKALTLVVNGEEITFSTLAEFEFALGGRTNVPASKMADLMMLSADELKREAKSIKAVEKRFVDILSRSIEQPREIGQLVREVDIQVFSNDFDWRAIFKALNQQDEDYDDLRRVAVVKYMQYLRSRQDVIKQAYKIKSRAPGHERRATDRAGAPPPTAGDESRDVFKETSIFDSVILEQRSKRAPRPSPVCPRVKPSSSAHFRTSNSSSSCPSTASCSATAPRPTSSTTRASSTHSRPARPSSGAIPCATWWSAPRYATCRACT